MRFLPALLTFALAAAPAAAQLPAGTGSQSSLVDRVIAVVGDTVLLQSDLLRAIDEQRSARQVPTEPAEFDRFADQVLQTEINDLILVEAARAAGIEVPEERINDLVQQQEREVERRFGSELALTTALAEAGLTREQYRRDLAGQFRDEQLVLEFMRSRMQNRARPVIDEREIREFFESYSGEIGQRPASVSFRQVVINPQPTPEARQAAIARAEEVLRELDSGADFEVVARRFSDDEGTRERGGDLGWFRAERMVPEFSRVAFALRPGQTSRIVESEYGFHIIRVDRVRGAERQARHVLIRPEIGEADAARARQSADSVATALRNGESAATLAARYNPADEVVNVSQLIDRLPREYGQALQTASVGDVVGPFQVEHPRAARWVVLRLTEKSEAGPATIDDVRDQIREQLQQRAMIQQLLEELRRQVYVEVRL